MLNDFAAGILEELRQPDRRPVSEWAADGNVILPHSKRCRDYREDTAYWLVEILNSITTNEATSVCKCTQGGGTTIYEVFTAWLIANAPADCSLMAQTDPDAERLFEEKVLPTLKASPATAAALGGAGRNDITKNKLKLGNMTFRVHGCGKNSMQSASLEVILGDECWLFDLGTILEILERTSTREATRKIVMVSQAGEELEDDKGRAMMDEWGQWWHRGTQEIYCVRAPCCGKPFEIETQHVTCDPSARDQETHEWDWLKVRATARLKTPCCGHVIENTETNRRNLSASGKYIATNTNPSPRHRSFRFSAWVVYWQDWGGLLEMFLRAQVAITQGNIEPLKIFTQKKEARWWTLKAREIPVVNTKKASEYVLADYQPKEGEPAPKWEVELAESVPPPRRMLGFDTQRATMPYIGRAFAPGRSRLLAVGEVQGWIELEDLAASLEIPAHLVLGDCGNWRAEVQKQCWLRGWTALRGRDVRNFTRIRGRRKMLTPFQKVRERLTGEKIFFHPSPRSASPVEISVDGRTFSVPRSRFDVSGAAFVDVWEWSNLHFKDILARLKVAPEWEFADDVPSKYIDSLESEAKDAKGIWRPIGKRPNHWWDCEAELTFGASLYKLIGGDESEEDEAEPEDA